MRSGKVVIVVQARMTSTRLPGKVLKPVLGKALLEYQIERLKRVKGADEVVVATTTNRTDDPVVELCAKLGIPSVRGDEHDVLSRYHLAASERQADTVVRVTADCPLIDPEVIDQVLARFKEKAGEIDYLSNSLERSYPRGLDVEVFTRRDLDLAFAEAKTPAQREHVTPFFYQNPERFRLSCLRNDRDLSAHRWTVDMPEDFELIRLLLEDVYPRKPEFRTADLLEALERHPAWSELNRHVEQKKL